MKNILLQVGRSGQYRKTFWPMAGPALRGGNIEGLIHVGLVGHHLIQFAQECGSGGESASYSLKLWQPQAVEVGAGHG